MSDVICLACSHGPHTAKKCGYCRCETFMNAELMASRALINLNNLLMEKIPVFEGMMFDLTEIVAEAFPEAVARVDARREERRRHIEDERNRLQAQETPPQHERTTTDQEGQDAGSGRSDGSPDSGVEVAES